jgi:hypothetical protein
MNNQQPIENVNHTIFERIREGMNVHDRNGDHIGKVEHVYFGSDAGTTQQHTAGAASAPDPSLRGNSFVDNIAEAIFGDDDLPETLRARLINNGFLRIDSAGLFASDRYVMREQIASVSGDDVHLNVTRDELIKR